MEISPSQMSVSEELERYKKLLLESKKQIPHSWKNAKVEGQRCDNCGLSGGSGLLRWEAYRCSVCSRVIHKNCMRLVPPNCCSDVRTSNLDLSVEYSQNGLFGRPLRLPQQDEVYFEGPLRMLSGPLKQWKERYFCVSRGEALMWWAEEPRHGAMANKVPDGNVILVGASIRPSLEGEFAFSVSCAGHYVVLAAENAEDREKWMAKLEQAQQAGARHAARLFRSDWWVDIPTFNTGVILRDTDNVNLLAKFLDDRVRSSLFETNVECFDADSAACPYTLLLTKVELADVIVSATTGEPLETVLSGASESSVGVAGTLSRAAHAGASPANMFVVVRTLYGAEEIAEPLYSPPSRADGTFATGRLLVTHTLSHLPPATHFLVSLYRRGDAGATPTCVGYASMALCDPWGRLLTGPAKLSLWPGEGSTISAADAGAPDEISVATIYLTRPPAPPKPCVYGSMYPDEFATKCPEYPIRGHESVTSTLQVEVDHVYHPPEWFEPEVTTGSHEQQQHHRRGALAVIRSPNPLDVISPEDRLLNWVQRDASDPVKLYHAIRAMDATDPLQRAQCKELLSDSSRVSLNAIRALLLLSFDVTDPTARALACAFLTSFDTSTSNKFAYILVSSLVNSQPGCYSVALEALVRGILRKGYHVAHPYFWVFHGLSRRPKPFAPMCSAVASILTNHFPELLDSVPWLDRLFQMSSDPRRTSMSIADFLNELGDPERTVTLPTSTEHCVDGVIREKCRIMSSGAAPVMIRFNPVVPAKPVPVIIFKAGDDLGQDHLVLFMVFCFNSAWQAANVNAEAIEYTCLPMGSRLGLIEVVPGCQSLGSLQDYTTKGSWSDATIVQWLKKQPGSYEDLKKRFIRTLTGAVLVEYVLGIGDRHSDNLLLRSDGSIFHIDFGMPFGHDWGITKTLPFVLTNQMAAVLGGQETAEWAQFIEGLVRAYMTLRRLHISLIAALMLCLGAEMKWLSRVENVQFVYSRLAPHLLDVEAERRFRETIRESLDSKKAQFNDMMHGFFIRHIYKHMKK